MKAIAWTRYGPPEVLYLEDVPQPAPKPDEVLIQVAAVGSAVTRFKVGDPIFGAMDMHLGAYADYVCLPERYPLVAKPAGISHIQASTLAVGGSNALHFIRHAQLQPGQHILINGADHLIDFQQQDFTRSDDLDHLADVVAAHHYVESGKRTGQVVLTVDPHLEATP